MSSAAEIRALAAHLDDCADCRGVLELVRRSYEVRDNPTTRSTPD